MYRTVMLLLLSVAVGCQPTDPEPRLRNAVRITDQLYASFAVLDMNGQPRTSFRQGENFQLSFKFRNVSDDTLYTSRVSPPLSGLFFLDNRNFFSVLKRTGSGQADQIMGRPISKGFGDFITPGGIVILPKTTFTYQVPWQTNVRNKSIQR